MLKAQTRADHYAYIVESAIRAIAADPTATLLNETTANISGGYTYWDDGADVMYASPATLDEALLALEMRDVLIIGIHNQLQKVLQVANHHEQPLSMFALPMDFGLLLSATIKLAWRDRLLALQVKLQMSQIATHFEPAGLSMFIARHCSAYPDDMESGEYFCSQF